jgi:hypothetical protein
VTTWVEVSKSFALTILEDWRVNARSPLLFAQIFQRLARLQVPPGIKVFVAGHGPQVATDAGTRE